MSPFSLTVMTCGNVDDGKSTLLGHFLSLCGGLKTDQRAALQKDSEQYGTQGKNLDYSLVFDGLLAEREQNITIDVSYRYLDLDQTRIIFADCPGHVEFTKNMVTAASLAQKAILVVDINKGLTAQSLRHVSILGLMQVNEVLIVVNKMDQVGYAEDKFNAFQVAFQKATEHLSFKNLSFLPASALLGDHLIARSEKMSWFQGPHLKEWLLTKAPALSLEQSTRFSIQLVQRTPAGVRRYLGKMISGELKNEATLFVSGKNGSCLVQDILCGFDQQSKATAGQQISLSLKEDIELTRGQVLTNAPSTLSHLIKAQIFWIGQTPGFMNRVFDFQLGHQKTKASLTKIELFWGNSEIMVGHPHAPHLKTNEIAKAELLLHSPLFVENYSVCAQLGSFILIDLMTQETVGAGIVESANESRHLFKESLGVTKAHRELLNGHRGFVVWMTGLSGSGKSTLANAVEADLHQRGMKTFILDGDHVRSGLNRDLGFSEGDRIENIRRVAEVAHLMCEAGMVVLVSFISPYERDRLMARDIIGADCFFEIYLSTPLAVCEARDTKGLYRRARAGEIADFSGVSAPYEAPPQPHLELNTETVSTSEAKDLVIRQLVPRIQK